MNTCSPITLPSPHWPLPKPSMTCLRDRAPVHRVRCKARSDHSEEVAACKPPLGRRVSVSSAYVLSALLGRLAAHETDLQGLHARRSPCTECMRRGSRDPARQAANRTESRGRGAGHGQAGSRSRNEGTMIGALEWLWMRQRRCPEVVSADRASSSGVGRPSPSRARARGWRARGGGSGRGARRSPAEPNNKAQP